MYALPYLLAVSLSTQDPAGALQRAQASLPKLDAQLQTASAALDMIHLEGVGRLAALGAQLGNLAALTQLSGLAELGSLGLPALAEPPQSFDGETALDPDDSLYRAGQRLLNRGRYAEAADSFALLIRRYPKSQYTADAHYWQAFALYKTGVGGNYRAARRILEQQRTRYPRAATIGDADALYARIQGELARQGDQEAAEWVRTHAGAAVPPGERRSQTTCAADDDDNPQVAALNALLQMDAEAAVPILKQVLARRDPCSVVLRRKAVFILSQKRTPETEDILLGAVRNDPDPEVREQGVFWLSQVGSERALSALDSILRTSQDPEIQKKALFAISQIHGTRAAQILRDYAQRSDASSEVREQAIFWLGQQHGAENAAFLRDLYARLTDEESKEKVIFSISQMHTEENARWLLDLALSEREPIEMRKKALFWAGQTGADLSGLVALYERTTNEEMKDQLIFVYSQRHEPEAVTKLIDIAQHETNRELRKKAIFWLGQSHDPRARQALLDIINQ